EAVIDPAIKEQKKAYDDFIRRKGEEEIAFQKSLKPFTIYKTDELEKLTKEVAEEIKAIGEEAAKQQQGLKERVSKLTLSVNVMANATPGVLAVPPDYVTKLQEKLTAIDGRLDTKSLSMMKLIGKQLDEIADACEKAYADQTSGPTMDGLLEQLAR